MREGKKLKLVAVAGDKIKSYYVSVRPGAVYSTIAGPVKGELLLEKGSGSIIRLSRGVVYVFEPTWMEILEHWGLRGTQVIYPKDSSYMVLRSGLRSGSRVFEAGLGSGFLSSVILSYICPDGLLFGFEVRGEFYERALKNISGLGLDSCLRAENIDVVEGLGKLDANSIDAGFLDLPKPERVLEEAFRVLKPSAILSVFLPTISQVERLLSSIDSDKWFVESVEEILLRTWEAKVGALRPSPRMIGHTGFLIFLRRLKEK